MKEEEEDEKERDGASAPSLSGKGTRLPEDWRPNEDLVARLIDDGMTAAVFSTQLRAFRNYWHSKHGNATKLNWDKMFDNWMIRVMKS